MGDRAPKSALTIVAVHDAFGFGGEGKEILPIEATETAGEAWIKLVEVVGACYHEDSVVVLKTLGNVCEKSSLD